MAGPGLFLGGGSPSQVYNEVVAGSKRAKSFSTFPRYLE
jgi:hypothetical protein